MAGEDDGLVVTRPLLDRIGDVSAFLADAEAPAASAALRAAETTGRPLGNEAFVRDLERILGRKLTQGRPGPAPSPKATGEQPGLWG